LANGGKERLNAETQRRREAENAEIHGNDIFFITPLAE
jgi:hypothetical protein